MRNVIRLGDPTSHGGKVVQVGATHYTVDGLPVACVDDLCTCPLPGHGQCRIVSGSDDDRVDGRKIAFQGDRTSCGAELLATCLQFGVD